MHATGTLYLSKTRPLATTAADGTFALTLLAFDRLGVHQVEPWRITYSGPAALAFWQAYQADLQPGRPLSISAERLRTYSNGRGGTPEVHAQVTRIALAPQLRLVSTPSHNQERPASCPSSHSH